MRIASSFKLCNSYPCLLPSVATSYYAVMRGDELKETRRENLLWLRERHTWESIAERSGTNPAYLSQIANRVIQKRGKTPRSLSDDYAAKIERGMGLPEGWMDQPRSASSELPAAPPALLQLPAPLAYLADDTYPREPSEADYALIPQYNVKGSCGNGHLNGHVEIKGDLVFRRDWLARLRVKPDQAAVIYASGDSMLPTLRDGAVVLLDLAQIEPRHGLIYALLVEGEIRIKRMFKTVTGSWSLVSDNPNKTLFPDEMIPHPDALQIIGRCVWGAGEL